MAANGIALRASSLYVTDAAGDTHSLGEAYPITRAGETFGWCADSTATARDRDTLRPKLAGIVFHANGSGTRYFRWDKPAGTYLVRVAIGDASNLQTNKVVIRDGVGGAVLATITGNTGVAEWIDATGVVRAGFDGLNSIWERDNVAASLTNASGAFVFEIGDVAAGSAATALAYVNIVDAVPPASVTLNANMDVFTSALALAEFIPSSLVISANMDVFISGMALAQAPGVINFGPLKNGSGFRWDRSDITAIIQDRTTGAVLATLTGVTSGASGGQLSSLSIQSGGLYRVSFRIPAGGLLPNGAKGEADLSGA